MGEIPRQGARGPSRKKFATSALCLAIRGSGDRATVGIGDAVDRATVDRIGAPLRAHEECPGGRTARASGSHHPHGGEDPPGGPPTAPTVFLYTMRAHARGVVFGVGARVSGSHHPHGGKTPGLAADLHPLGPMPKRLADWVGGLVDG